MTIEVWFNKNKMKTFDNIEETREIGRAHV